MHTSTLGPQKTHTRHMVIPDTQIKPGSSIEPMIWAAHYAIDKRPDTIIHLGDHWDMESLCTYDYGKKEHEGKRIIADIEAGHNALNIFTSMLQIESERLKRNRQKQWNPRLVFCLGNHEDRINKAINLDAKLEGLLSTADLRLEELGWEVYDFLEPVVIDGIAYAHYFTSGIMGRPVSSARILLIRKHMSCIMGHVQDRDMAFSKRADGKRLTGIFAGVYYDEYQNYLTPQTNDSWAGVWLLNEVNEGSFDEMPVSLNYLKQKYS